MLGKLPPKKDSRTLKFKNYVADAGSPPRAVDFSKAVKRERWPVFANDRFPCCTCAAAGHMIQVWSANAGSERILPDRAILKAYLPFQHDVHKPRRHLLDILNHWRRKGIGGQKIAAYAQLSLRNRDQVKAAISMFGAAYIGIGLPDFAAGDLAHLRRTPWVVRHTGPTSARARRRRNGHCIAAVGYDSKNLHVITWGKMKRMSWEFYETYMEEAFAVVNKQFIDRKRAAASALDIAALTRDVRQVTKPKR